MTKLFSLTTNDDYFKLIILYIYIIYNYISSNRLTFKIQKVCYNRLFPLLLSLWGKPQTVSHSGVLERNETSNLTLDMLSLCSLSKYFINQFLIPISSIKKWLILLKLLLSDSFSSFPLVSEAVKAGIIISFKLQIKLNTWVDFLNALEVTTLKLVLMHL